VHPVLLEYDSKPHDDFIFAGNGLPAATSANAGLSALTLFVSSTNPIGEGASPPAGNDVPFHPLYFLPAPSAAETTLVVIHHTI